MMTDPRKLQYAKMYIESLANGLNPFDGTPIPENEVARDVRLSRCFAYVAGVLGQVEKINAKQVREAKTPMKPFTLTPEQKAMYVPPLEPITVSEMVKQLNNLADLMVCEKLKHRQVFSWLCHEGYLESVTKVTPDGRKSTSKYATEKGRALGIIPEYRTGERGSYTVNLLTQNAQMFLLGQLDTIAAWVPVDETEEPVEPQAVRRNFESQGFPWTPPQEEYLVYLYKNGKDINEISFTMQRSPGGIRARLEKLGLIAKDGE